MLTTVKGIMKPDGKIELDDCDMPQGPVKVLVTILDEEIEETKQLSEQGDYLKQLESYEDALAKGSIQWK